MARWRAEGEATNAKANSTGRPKAINDVHREGIKEEVQLVLFLYGRLPMLARLTWLLLGGNYGCSCLATRAYSNNVYAYDPGSERCECMRRLNGMCVSRRFQL